MDKIKIKGVILTPLKKIYHPQGSIFQGMKKSDIGFVDFGEAYFSTIKYGAIKSWKKHIKMTLNLIVPFGQIRFIMYDDRINSVTQNNFMEITLSNNNYCRLTVPPNVWLAFQGISKDFNLLLNISDIEHNPSEINRLELNEIKFNW